MPLSRDAVLLRIFIGEDDKVGHQPALRGHRAESARDGPGRRHRVARTAWASVIRAMLHTTKILRLSQDLPLVIEIVDNEDKINAFVDAIEPIMGSALVTTEKVKVIRYGEGGPCEPS